MNQDRSTAITNSQLKEGYKQTEVGVIPDDWNATNLGKFTMLQRGYDLPHRERKIGDIPIITSSGFGGTHSESKALAPGVVTGRYGTIGDVFYVQEDFWPLNTTLYVKNFYGNNPLFASYLLKTVDFHSHSGKSGVPGVNRNDLHELVVCIPPLPEQEAIACTLSNIDALIESLDRLLTKKRQIKQGTMQELLRSKEGWIEKSLGEVASFFKGKGLPKSEIIPFATYPCIHYGELFTKYPETILNVQSRTNINTGVFYSVSNDVLMPTSDVTPNGLATASCILEDGVILGGDVLVIRIDPKELNGSFLSYIIRYSKKQIMQLVSGTTVYHLYGSDMRKFSFSMPPINEQIEIANIISDMDAEIGSISAKLTKTRQLKQGMMHELLTGRIRLV
jgi:type I restriction enzyme, S subunit